MDADAWTLMVLVYLFVAVNQEPELYIRCVITLINVMKLCKGILIRVLIIFPVLFPFFMRNWIC
jgi:hypothetical protein